MSTGAPGQPRSREVTVVAGRLWAGGLATGCVAALVAAVGVLLCSEVLDVRLVPVFVVPITESLAVNYAITAFVLALAATGIAQLLSLSAPRPRVFFRWIVALVTVAAIAAPFALEGTLAGKVSTALINLAIGIAIGALLSAVLSRTVVDAEQSWQRG